jgi:NAD(P) transhydrogenase subunit alpha
MNIGVPAESRSGESRVAATPETVKKFVAAKHTVVVEANAGKAASFPDETYVAAGATIGGAADALGAQTVLKVRTPQSDELAQMKRGTVIIGIIRPYNEDAINTAL